MNASQRAYLQRVLAKLESAKRNTAGHSCASEQPLSDAIAQLSRYIVSSGKPWRVQWWDETEVQA